MWQYKKENSKLSMTDWPCHVWLQKIVWHTNKAVLGGGGGVVTCFYAPFWVMELSVLYHQTIIFTKENGVYQQWKICPLKSKKGRKCIFQGSGEPNFKLMTKQTVKKLNIWEKTAVDKSAWIKAWYIY